VAVYNATDIKGAARVTAERLEAMMYDAFSGGNTKAQADLSTVVYRTAAVESRARDLAKSLGITSISKATDDQLKIEHLGSNEPDVYVTIGKDLADQIVAARSTSTVSSERPLGG
jgi:hypothetical protein